MFLYTKSRLLVAEEYERIVTNDFGASYYEIKNILIQHIHVPESKKWKLKFKDQKNQKIIDYIEYRTNKDSVKIYYQLRTVDYADYKIGFYYISKKKVVEKENPICTLGDFLKNSN